MSMYKDYVENQLPNRFVHEDDNGFITYHFKDNICFLEEIYIIPEKRRQGIASHYYDLMYDIAKKNNCIYLIGSIILGTSDIEGSMKCLFENGFKLNSINDNMIYLKKEIKS